MRDIKFRGWDGERMLPPEDLSVSPDGRKWLGHVDVLLLQFTGLKDSKGVEIYEDDILEHEDGSIGTVEWWTTLSRFVVGFDDDDEDDHVDELNRYEMGYKVIGNIHENPDLIPT